LSSDTVQISLTVLGDSSAAVLGLFQDTNLLESLDNSSVDRAGGVLVVGWSGATVDSVTVMLVESANTNVLVEVDVSGNGGGSLVEPALSVLRWELVTGGGLDEFDVAWNLKLALTLKELSVSVDELLGRDVSITLVSTPYIFHFTFDSLSSRGFHTQHANLILHYLDRPLSSRSK
jgi:hypothetical protein